MKRFSDTILLSLLEAYLLFALLFIFTRHVLFFDFVCDDAFISFRYARNLVEHGELVYNTGIRVEGYSNFLWTLAIAGGLRLGLDPVNLAQTMGWLFGALGIFLTWRAGLSLSRPEEQPQQVSLFFLARLTTLSWDKVASSFLCFTAPAILALSSSYACWSSGGLETQGFTFLLTAAVVRFLIEEREELRYRREMPRRYSALLFALATMMRPEGFAFFVLAVAWRAGKVLLRMALAGGDLPPRRFIARDTEGLFIFLLFLAPWLTWKIYYYGDIFPNTFYVKSGGLKMFERGWFDLRHYANQTKIYILVPFILMGGVAGISFPTRMRWGTTLAALRHSLPPAAPVWDRGFLLLCCGFMTLYYLWIGGDFMELARFLVPVFPMAALLVQEGILFLQRQLIAAVRWCFRSSQSGPVVDLPPDRAGNAPLLVRKLLLPPVLSRVATIATQAILLFVFANFQLEASRYAMTDHSTAGIDSIGYLKKASQQWETVARWIKHDAGGKGGMIATSAAGVIPYYTGLPTLDLLGINDPLIPRASQPVGNRPGHMRSADWNYILLWRPKYLLGHPEIDPQPKHLSEIDRAYMASFGYRRRVVKIDLLDPPYFSFWYRD